MKALGATTAGAAVSAGITTTLNGGSFADQFRFNLIVGTSFLLGAAAWAELSGSGIKFIGADTPLNATIGSKGAQWPIGDDQNGAITFGNVSDYSNTALDTGSSFPGVSFAQHEYGHFIQYTLLMALGREVGSALYLSLGAYGAVDPNHTTNFWEKNATEAAKQPHY